MRTEHDLLGDREVPREAYYGVHTMRAVENFPISGIAISAYPELIGALAAIKQAAALSNMELGLLDQRRARLARAAPCQVPGAVCRRHAPAPVRRARHA